LGEASERCDPGAGDQEDGHYQDNVKHEAAKRWIAAVNDWVEPGPWAFHVNKNLQMLAVELRYLTGRA
jgi:hypothetical protein